jgi:glutamine amidotransferase
MQLMFSKSAEGNVDCLDLIKGQVKKFNRGLKIPQIGWNQVTLNNNSKLLAGIKNKSYFYFVNSYFCDPEDKTIVKGLTDYGQIFCSVLEKNNLCGLQFHPEKSSRLGQQLLKNWRKTW